LLLCGCWLLAAGYGCLSGTWRGFSVSSLVVCVDWEVLGGPKTAQESPSGGIGGRIRTLIGFERIWNVPLGVTLETCWIQFIMLDVKMGFGIGSVLFMSCLKER